MRMNTPLSGVKTLKLLKIILLFCFVQFPIQATQQIYTTHPQVAHSLNFLVEKLEPVPILAISLFENMVNVHDFEPTTGDLKKLKDKSPLFAGPVDHQRWVLNAKESGLLPAKNLLITFQSKGSEHFWLEVERGCEFEEIAYKTLKEWKLLDSGYQSQKYCDWLKERQTVMKSLFKDLGLKKVILTHSALSHFMRGIGLEVLVLRNDDHQKETPPHKLKQAFNWMKEPKNVLLIHESGFHLPHQLAKANFPMITWSPLKAKPEPLLNLQRELEKLKEKR